MGRQAKSVAGAETVRLRGSQKSVSLSIGVRGRGEGEGESEGQEVAERRWWVFGAAGATAAAWS